MDFAGIDHLLGLAVGDALDLLALDPPLLTQPVQPPPRTSR
jgi:hypothetical protein